MLQTCIFNKYIKNNNITLYGGRDELGAASLYWRGQKERMGGYLTENGV